MGEHFLEKAHWCVYLLSKKTTWAISGAIAAVAIALVITLGPVNLGSIPPAETDVPSAPVTKNSPSEQIGAYRINTECEMIYGFVAGVYPDGGDLTTLKIDYLISKYPEDFAPWAGIFANNQTKEAFLKQPFPNEFKEVLVASVMREFSINPSLKPIVMLITDPEGDSKLQDAFDKYDCQDYFNSRSNQ